ncbi:uncharacterized protein [Mytilus edulis]
MDTDFYKEKVLEQLNDEEYYKQITNNPDKATKKRLKKLIKDYNQCLTEKEIAYLCDFDPKESNFYGLPKVHKNAQIQNTVRDQNNIYVETFGPADLKLSPIIAGPESLTQRLSHFIDLVIKHLCPSIPSYIKDDMAFLNHIPAIVLEETLLTSFDVTSLYTNIPHDLGLTAVKYRIEEKRDEIDSRFETNFILEATKIVLEENTFYFDGNKYRQIKGTAMGTKVVPTYANLVMGYLEQQMYRQISVQFDQNFCDYVIKFWKRYLDDCIIFWSRSEKDLYKFKDLINSLHPSIKFTMETSDTQLPFLDFLILKSGRHIKTDIYYKSTDAHQYLNFHSCHPSHTKRNIPYCMARRICAIVTDHNIRGVRLKELKGHLTQQLYPDGLIESGIRKSKLLTLQELRTPKVKDTDETLKKIPFVSTHDP